MRALRFDHLVDEHEIFLGPLIRTIKGHKWFKHIFIDIQTNKTYTNGHQQDGLVWFGVVLFNGTCSQ